MPESKQHEPKHVLRITKVTIAMMIIDEEEMVLLFRLVVS